MSRGYHRSMADRALPAGTTCSRARSSPTSAPSRRATPGSRRCRRARTRACARRSQRAASTRSTRTRPRPGRRPQRGEHLIVTTGTASRQDARVQPARARRARARAEARARSTSTRRRRSRRTRRARSRELGCPSVRAAIYDGDTPRERRWQIRKWANVDPDQPGHAPRRRPAAPRPLGRRALEPRATWSSTRRTSTAASSARTSRTSCGGCGGSRASTAPSRSSCSPRRRSRTPASSRTRCSASTRRSSATTRRRAPSARSRSGTRRSSTRSSACARARSARRRRCWPTSSRAACARSASPRAASAAELVHRFTAERLGDGSAALARTAPATRRRSGARSSGGSSRASCSASRRRTRSSSGSTSACSTASISVGFPGTVASLRQQWGRAGRRGHGLAVLVASEDALDQYFMREPEALLGRRVEAAILDHENPRVLDGHVARRRVRGAARRRRPRRARRRGARARGRSLPELKQTKAGCVWAGRDYPAARVALRSTGADAVHGRRRRDRRACSASSSASARYSTVHEGAIYLHLGEQYLVRELDLGARTRRRRAVPRRLVHAGEEGDDDRDRASRCATERRLGLELSFGRVSVTEQVVALPAEVDPRRRRRSTSSPLDLPQTTFETEAVWFLPEPGPARRARADAAPARLAARGRARADRAAAALGDVRPLGHRRALDEPPLPDRAGRRSSSTTATPAASGSPSAASRPSRAGSRTPRGCSPAARASTAAPRASRARSAAT